jgi:hypothetical protein
MSDIGLIGLMVLSIGLPIVFVVVGLIGRMNFRTSWLGLLYKYLIGIPRIDDTIGVGQSHINYLFGGLSRKAIIISSVGSILSVVYLATGLLGVVPFYGTFAIAAIFLTMSIVTPLVLSAITANRQVVDYFSRPRPDARRASLCSFLHYDGRKSQMVDKDEGFLKNLLKVSVYLFCFTESYYFYFWIVNLFPGFPAFSPLVYLVYCFSIFLYLQNGGNYKVILTDALQLVLICICVVLGYIIFFNYSVDDFIFGAEAYAMPGLFRDEVLGFNEYFMTVSCIVGLVVVYGSWYLASQDMWVRISHLIIRNAGDRSRLTGGKVGSRATFGFMSLLLVAILGLVMLVGVAGAGKFERDVFDSKPESVSDFLKQQSAYSEIGISVFRQLIYPPEENPSQGTPDGPGPGSDGYLARTPIGDVLSFWHDGSVMTGSVIGVLVFCVLCMCAMTSLDTAVMSLSQIDYDYRANVKFRAATISEIDIFESIGKNSSIVFLVLGPVTFHIVSDFVISAFDLDRFGISVMHLFAAVMISAGYSVFIVSVNLAMLVVFKLLMIDRYSALLPRIRKFFSIVLMIDGLIITAMFILYILDISFEPLIHRNMLMNLGVMTAALFFVFVSLAFYFSRASREHAQPSGMVAK